MEMKMTVKIAAITPAQPVSPGPSVTEALPKQAKHSIMPNPPQKLHALFPNRPNPPHKLHLVRPNPKHDAQEILSVVTACPSFPSNHENCDGALRGAAAGSRREMITPSRAVSEQAW